MNNTNHWINLGWNRCFEKIDIFGSPCGTVVLLLSKLCWYRKCMDDFWFLEGTVIFPRPSDKNDSSGEYFLFSDYESFVFLLPNTLKLNYLAFKSLSTRGRYKSGNASWTLNIYIFIIGNLWRESRQNTAKL